MKEHTEMSMEISAGDFKGRIRTGILLIALLLISGCAFAPPKPVTIKHAQSVKRDQLQTSRQEKAGEKTQTEAKAGEKTAIAKEPSAQKRNMTPVTANDAGTDKVAAVRNADVSGKSDGKESAVGSKATPAEVPDKKVQSQNSTVSVREEAVKSDEPKTAVTSPLVPEKSAPAVQAVPAAPVSSATNVSKDHAQQARQPDMSTAQAGNAGDAAGVAILLDLLIQKKVIDTSEAERLMKKYGEKKAETAVAAAPSAAVPAPAAADAGKTAEGAKAPAAGKDPAVQQDQAPVAVKIDDAQVDDIMDGVKEELKSDITDQVHEEVKKRVAEELPGHLKKTDFSTYLPDWIKRLELNADLRLRYEHLRYDGENYRGFSKLNQGVETNEIVNVWSNTDNFKYRARLGLQSKNQYYDAVISLATGNTTNPISTNTLLGDYMNKDNIVLDLAYVKLKPWSFLSVTGGRMPNPWFSTDLVWDNDLNFEGLVVGLQKPVNPVYAPFLTLGVFPLKVSDTSGTDDSQHKKWLYAAQTGLEIKKDKILTAKLGAAYYHFSNVSGELNESGYQGMTDWSAPFYNQRGNTVFYIDPYDTSTTNKKFGLASEFREINITGMLDLGFWDPVRVVLIGDYVRNIGYSAEDVLRKVGDAQYVYNDVDGYRLGLNIGHAQIRDFGQWRASLHYKYLGHDAVIDAFTDSDFNMGTNARGWIAGFDLGLTKNVWLSSRWTSTKQIEGPQLIMDAFFMDLNVKF